MSSFGRATAYTRGESGLAAPEVAVEVNLGGGLDGLVIVGLAETAVQESRERVRAALGSAGLAMPEGRVLVNLAPADLPKQGSRYDLAIACAILAASRQVPARRLGGVELFGELGVGGELRRVPRLLPALLGALGGKREAVVPCANAGEAALPGGNRVRLAAHLTEAVRWLAGGAPLAAPPRPDAVEAPLPDMAAVLGQQHARRALEIVAAGGHHLLLSGPPGTGKSLLAERLPGLLPPPGRAHALETAALYSLAGLDARPWFARRPFRAPHHCASAVALVGGGRYPAPGEISLAHGGVLFLDELPEFNRQALESLRQPLESGSISIARAARSTSFPARFQLVAAMNPCPCGYAGDARRQCRCSPDRIARYQAKVSGPLLDRIDVHVSMTRAAARLPAAGEVAEPSACIAPRVAAARERARARQGCVNARLAGDALWRHAAPGREARALLRRAAERLALSHRAVNAALKVARSIADLAGDGRVSRAHMAEALSLGYREPGYREPGQPGDGSPR